MVSKIKNKINVILVASLLIILLGLFLTGTFLDFKISKNLLNESSFFGLVFDQFGQIAFLIPLNFLIIALITFFRFNRKNQVTLFFAIYFIYSFFISLATIIYLCLDLVGSLNWETIVSIFIVLVIYFLFLAFSVIYLVNEPAWLIEDEKALTSIILAILLIGIFMLSTQFFKYIFSRPRPIDVINSNLNYHEWWKINYEYGFGENKSFPSGHTTSAMCMISPLILFKTKSREKINTIILTSIFVFLVALSRIIVGAHFLTDVIGAIIISNIWLFLIIILNKKIKEKK